MTDLRTAAQQALEALTSRDGDGWTRRFARDRAIEALEAALGEPGSDYEHGFVDGMSEQARRSVDRAVNALAEPVAFDHGIGADRFKVVRGAFWWHVLIGDSPTEHGKFRSRASAEKMAADLLREFRNGAFVQHEAALAEPVVNQQLTTEPVQQGCEHCNQPLYAAVKCRVCGRVTKSERNFCPRCGKRTQGIHTCTPPGDCDVHG